MPTLDCILPLTFREPGLALRRWRHDPDDSAEARTRLLLASFLRYFDQRDLGRFWLVCPAAEQDAVRALLRTLTDDPRYTVLAERELCPEIALLADRRTGEVDGWRAQQLIKLAIAGRVQSPYYLTLDSDIVCFRPCSASHLLPDGRALLNVETAADYRRLYTEARVGAREKTWRRRFKAAGSILGATRSRARQGHYYGETPVLLHTASVQALCAHIGDRFGKPWAAVLAAKAQWTEYALYFLFLELRQTVERVYRPGHCNSLLNLTHSIWDDSASYRYPRDYRHWPQDAEGRWPDDGYFLALQSRLSGAEWLPAEIGNVAAFYRQLGARLLPSS